MTIQRIKSGPRISAAVVHSDTACLAGQVTRNTAGGSVAEQTKDIRSIIDTLLAGAGTDKTKLLMPNIWLTAISTFAEMNAAWDAWVAAGQAPARATVEAKLAETSIRLKSQLSPRSTSPPTGFRRTQDTCTFPPTSPASCAACKLRPRPFAQDGLVWPNRKIREDAICATAAVCAGQRAAKLRTGRRLADDADTASCGSPIGRKERGVNEGLSCSVRAGNHVYHSWPA